MSPQAIPVRAEPSPVPCSSFPSQKKRKKTPTTDPKLVGRKSTPCLLKKRRNRRRLFKQTLFPPCGKEDRNEQEFQDLLPNLLQNLRVTKQVHDFMSLARLIATNRFPLDNISFALLLDVARFYSLSNTRNMTYPDSTKLFWRVGYKLFHGSFIRFMSGGKLEGQLIDGESDDETSSGLNPTEATINFAVPDIKLLREFNACASMTELPRELPPGIIEQSIEMKANTNNRPNVSYVVSVDGKKIAPGLSETGGDEDLFGHEKPALEERKRKLQGDIDAVELLSQAGQLSVQALYDVVQI